MENEMNIKRFTKLKNNDKSKPMYISNSHLDIFFVWYDLNHLSLNMIKSNAMEIVVQ